MEVTVEPGDTSELNSSGYWHTAHSLFLIGNVVGPVAVVLDTNIWYHKTSVVSEDVSITIGSEYD